MTLRVYVNACRRQGNDSVEEQPLGLALTNGDRPLSVSLVCSSVSICIVLSRYRYVYFGLEFHGIFSPSFIDLHNLLCSFRICQPKTISRPRLAGEVIPPVKTSY